jgi:hypothetical protein
LSVSRSGYYQCVGTKQSERAEADGASTLSTKGAMVARGLPSNSGSLALRAAEILGFQGAALERFFCDEFGVEGVTGNTLGAMLAYTML